ncbi:MAG: hypothetical protein BAW33_05035 [Desulfobacterales bacterium C00003104]|jgi:hypothetical protein|nr:MAG: hypothetical protein BAW33_05035 [Desulfobacterales bacterium C00003104]
MICSLHGDRDAVVLCQKFSLGYCMECLQNGLKCKEPIGYCKFRSQCIIWEQCRDKIKKEKETEDRI